MKTGQLVFNRRAYGTGGMATLVEESVSWVATVTPAGVGKTIVRLEPRMFSNGADISEGEVWNVPYLKTQWQHLFKEIDDALPGTVKSVAPSAKSI